MCTCANGNDETITALEVNGQSDSNARLTLHPNSTQHTLSQTATRNTAIHTRSTTVGACAALLLGVLVLQGLGAGNDLRQLGGDLRLTGAEGTRRDETSVAAVQGCSALQHMHITHNSTCRCRPT